MSSQIDLIDENYLIEVVRLADTTSEQRMMMAYQWSQQMQNDRLKQLGIFDEVQEVITA